MSPTEVILVLKSAFWTNGPLLILVAGATIPAGKPGHLLQEIPRPSRTRCDPCSSPRWSPSRTCPIHLPGETTGSGPAQILTDPRPPPPLRAPGGCLSSSFELQGNQFSRCIRDLLQSLPAAREGLQVDGRVGTERCTNTPIFPSILKQKLSKQTNTRSC